MLPLGEGQTRQTLIKALTLIWVYTVCSGLSVQIFGNMVISKRTEVSKNADLDQTAPFLEQFDLGLHSLLKAV